MTVGVSRRFVNRIFGMNFGDELVAEAPTHVRVEASSVIDYNKSRCNCRAAWQRTSPSRLLPGLSTDPLLYLFSQHHAFQTAHQSRPASDLIRCCDLTSWSKLTNRQLGTPLMNMVDFLENTARIDADSCSGGGGEKTKHTVSYKPYQAPSYQDHDHKNMGLKRPMSPHLFIYAPTMPAMTSIMQRITGVVLTFYAFTVSFATLFLSNGIDSYVSIIQSMDLSRPLLFIAKLIIGFPFAFHYFFGIRFCAWNAGKWLNMKQVYSSAKNMGIGTAILTVLFALL